MELTLFKRTFKYQQQDIIRGAIVYCTGDTIASLILNEFSVLRMAGILLTGAIVYAFEIPNYFAWIEQKVTTREPVRRSLQKTTLALLYFNPLWIARHLFFIRIFSGMWDQINISLITIAFWSFVWNIPVSFIANFLIQNKVSISWRFLASAVFSGLMAIYYALSTGLFS